jgi:hypothetical protein
LVDQEYKNPLNDVTGSVWLCGKNFFNIIKDCYLTGLKQSKDVPAVRALVKAVCPALRICELFFSSIPALAAAIPKLFSVCTNLNNLLTCWSVTIHTAPFHA